MLSVTVYVENRVNPTMLLSSKGGKASRAKKNPEHSMHQMLHPFKSGNAHILALL